MKNTINPTEPLTIVWHPGSRYTKRGFHTRHANPLRDKIWMGTTKEEVMESLKEMNEWREPFEFLNPFSPVFI